MNYRIITAHDYLTQKGGAERVALELLRATNSEYLITAFYSKKDTFPECRNFNIKTSIMNNIGIFRSDPRFALLLLPIIWSCRRPIAADAVVCSSSGWAHGIPVAAGVHKVVYCHNPPRWLYQPEDYFIGKKKVLRNFIKSVHPFLFAWDQRAAHSADIYIANSTSVAKRIRDVYGIRSEVVFPPVCLDVNGPFEAIKAIEGPFFLTIGRARGYKGTRILVDAFGRMPEQQLYIVGVAAINDCPDNVHPLGSVSDSQLRWLYANARALVSVSKEDFGLTPIEANAFGTPALLLHFGGFLDSLDEGVTGLFIEDTSEECVVQAVKSFPDGWNRNLIKNHARKFTPQEFGRKINAIVDRVIGGEKGKNPAGRDDMITRYQMDDASGRVNVGISAYKGRV